MIFSRSIYVAAKDIISFIFMIECHTFLIHLSIGGHLGCFHVLAVVNSVAMNTGVHLAFPEFSSFPDICTRLGLLVTYGN